MSDIDQDLAKARATAELYKATATRKFTQLVEIKAGVFRKLMDRDPKFIYLGDEEKAIWDILMDRSLVDLRESDITKKNPPRLFMGMHVLFVSADSHLNVA